MNMNNNKGENEKLDKILRTVKRIFPHWVTEIAVTLTVLSCVLFASQIIPTASLGNEMAHWKTETEKIESSSTLKDETEPTIEAEFEINKEHKTKEITITYQPTQMCFIGDSRVYGMKTVVAPPHVNFIAKSSMGLDWLKETASVEFESIKDNINICVVALGVNDISNADEYIKYLNEFAEKYPDKIMVYVNIGPVNNDIYTGIPNSSLEKFNKKLAEGLSDKWQILDQYAYLTETGFASDDGLHYGAKDCMRIYSWIVDSVKTQTIVEVIN